MNHSDIRGSTPHDHDSSRAASLEERELETGGSITRHTQVVQDARFIWTKNLRLDNMVLARYTATGPRQGAARGR